MKKAPVILPPVFAKKPGEYEGPTVLNAQGKRIPGGKHDMRPEGLPTKERPHSRVYCWTCRKEFKNWTIALDAHKLPSPPTKKKKDVDK